VVAAVAFVLAVPVVLVVLVVLVKLERPAVLAVAFMGTVVALNPETSP
jgi:hypothetical protein